MYIITRKDLKLKFLKESISGKLSEIEVLWAEKNLVGDI